MYTEEELLEAVNILVEEYGYDEDEAIDMVNEACEEELLDEMDMGVQAHNLAMMNHHNAVAHNNMNFGRRSSQEQKTAESLYNAYKHYKNKKSENKKSKDKNKKSRKKLREDYGIFEEDGELFIENEMVEAVMESYELTEEEAIDVIMESYEEELNENVLNRSKIPASVTYHRYINAQNKANSRKREGNADKYEKAVKKADKLEGKLRKQVGEYNDYQNKRFVKYTSKGKSPKKYNQIYLK